METTLWLRRVPEFLSGLHSPQDGHRQRVVRMTRATVHTDIFLCSGPFPHFPSPHCPDYS